MIGNWHIGLGESASRPWLIDRIAARLIKTSETMDLLRVNAPLAGR